MIKIDHLVVNIDQSYQNDNDKVNTIISAGYPYEPKWGKGTKGFKASNIWIGAEYFELINILKPDGGGWKEQWIEKYNEGHRGLICIILETDDLDAVYQRISENGVDITEPEYLKFKWFFNLLTRTMPWRNSYTPFFEGVPMQLSIQQMKDQKSKDFMTQYMIPNSSDNGILGMKDIKIKGAFTDKDFDLIKCVFSDYREEEDSIVIILPSKQNIIFTKDTEYSVELYVDTDLKCEHKGKDFEIENIRIINI